MIIVACDWCERTLHIPIPKDGKKQVFCSKCKRTAVMHWTSLDEKSEEAFASRLEEQSHFFGGRDAGCQGGSVRDPVGQFFVFRSRKNMLEFKEAILKMERNPPDLTFYDDLENA